MLRSDVISEIMTFIEPQELLRNFVLASKSFLAAVKSSLIMCEKIKVLSSNLSKVVEKCPNIKHMCLIFKEKYKAQEIAPAFDSLHKLTGLWLVFIGEVKPVFPLKLMIGLQNLLRLEKVYVEISSVPKYLETIPHAASIFDKQKYLLIKDLNEQDKNKGFSEDLFQTEIFLKTKEYLPKAVEMTESLKAFCQRMSFDKFQKLAKFELCKDTNNKKKKYIPDFHGIEMCYVFSLIKTLTKLTLVKLDCYKFDMFAQHLKHEGIKNLTLFIEKIENPIKIYENSIIASLQGLKNLEKLTFGISDTDFSSLASFSIHLIALVLSSKIKRINGVPVKDLILNNPCQLSIDLNSFEASKPIAYALLAYFITPLSKMSYVRIRGKNSRMNYSIRALETLSSIRLQKLEILQYLIKAEKEKSYNVSSYLSTVLPKKQKFSQKQLKCFENLSVHIDAIYKKQLSYEEMTQQLNSIGIFFYGHRKPVTCILYIDSYDLVATSSEGISIILFNSKSYKSAATLSGHTSRVTCLNYFKSQLISGSYDLLVKIWDLNSFSEIMSFSGHTGWITAVLITESNLPVSASSDCSARIWNLSTLTHKSTILSLESWNEFVITGCGDCIIYVWNIGSFQLLKKINHHTSPVLFIKSIEDRAYTVGKDGKLLVLSLPEFQKVSDMTKKNTPIVGLCAVGSKIAYYSLGQVEIISNNEKLVKEIEESNGITSACFIDENTLACVINHDCIIYWNLETNDKVKIWSAQQLLSEKNDFSVELYMKYLRVNKQF